ncbi:MAG TPA: class I SAM-dependent methyltransferase [Gemmatimonadaceae bacterium]
MEDRSFWFGHRNRFLIEVMRRYPPASPLYDVGGGNGVVAAALRDAGIKAVVIEPGEAGARHARERGLEAVAATLETSGLPTASAPAIGLFDVIEHIEDAVSFLRTARHYLRPGGRLYVAVPAYRALWSAEDDYAKHFRRYTSGSLRHELRVAGFKVELTTYMFAVLPIPILLMRALPYRLGFSRPFTPDGARSDHVLGGLSRAMMDGVHRLELSAFSTFGTLPFGASVVAVATNPGDR